MSFSNISFILHKPQLSENIGACARAIKNFNFKKLIIVNPKPLFPNDKILATSVGAKDVIKSSKMFHKLENAIKKMDAVSLHVPLTEKTKNLINYELLKTMKKNCIIINAARGGIINETDLDKALNENLIFGAGIDVFEKEPPDENNPLLKNDKVFLSPHTAAFTEECMTRMGIETIQNIIDFFDNKLEESKIVKL